MSKRINNKIEIEYKFKLESPVELFVKIEGDPKITYIKDEIYGTGLGVPPKVRKRTIVDEQGIVSVNYEKTQEQKGKIKTVQEEDVKGIPKNFKIENSYEKIRYLYDKESYDIAIDFYSIGIYCEIEGPERIITRVAKELGLDVSKTLTDNIDSLYRKNKNYNNLYHWGFGKL